uniref:Uncharacterized protein n=1 Tax=Spumella elongata TaxID=89044 RepID=A0A7S3HPI1_9STRA|mmetsp:Transcript_6140/g.10324  ORF Transcript_6140/g.10324 Transcript_6140/m.10324 type:complete len:299 (+) Transcript_6140:61-957(+)
MDASVPIDEEDLLGLMKEDIIESNFDTTTEGLECSSSIKLESNIATPATTNEDNNKSILQKRSREKDELETLQKKYVSVIARQVALKNNYLLRFPNAFANCVNGANFTGLSELMDSYLFYNCNIRYAFSDDTKFTCAGGAGLVKFFYYVNLFYPDRITMVHTATAANTKLNARFNFKFTDNKYIYNSVVSRPIDPTYCPFYPPARAESLRRKMHLDAQPTQIQEKFQSIVESDKDLVVYGSINMEMEIQEITEKIIGMNVTANFASVHEVTEKSDAESNVDINMAFHERVAIPKGVKC